MSAAPGGSRSNPLREPEPPQDDTETVTPSREALYDTIRVDGQRLATGLIALLHAMAERMGLNPTDFQCYLLLQVSGPMTPSEIADRLRLATGSVTGVIDRLEEHALVNRTRHPGDRRKVIVGVSDDAAPLAGDGSAVGMREAMVALHERYSAGELNVIADWLSRVGSTLADVASGTHRG